jgi:hypothetical protein
MTDPEDATEWHTLFELLSLDRVVPFYDEMGLNLADKVSFVSLLRRMLTESVAKDNQVTSMGSVESMLEQLRNHLGEERYRHFHRWATNVFYWAPSDQAQWSIWDDIIPRRAHHLPEDLPPDRWNAIAEFQLAKSTDDVKQRVQMLKQEPLSDWDAEMYKRSNYQDKESSDDIFEEDSVDPLSPIINTIEMNRMQLAWPKLWSHFSEDEKYRFWRYGQVKLAEWELGELFRQGLLHPDSLEAER